uniref:Serpentine receptor class gamma n=1 Tax=Panagrolaimus davidi TaxID=227884 RepID=A0A914QXK4_9BILA
MSVDVIGILPNAMDASDVFEKFLSSEDQEKQLILQTCADILMNICLFFMISIIIFLINELLKPDSQLRSSYFALITFGMILYSTFIIGKDIGYIFSDIDIKSFINNLIQWYMSLDLACWNTFLALNRATALSFPVGHDRFWTKNLTIFYCLFVFGFPFIVDFKTFFYPCFWKGFTTNCTTFQLEDQVYASAWTMAHALFALLITIVSLTYSKSKGFDAARKVECRLMFQTVFGSTMITLFAISQWLSVHFFSKKDRVLFIQFLGISQFLSAFYFYPIIFVLFFARFVF